MNAMQATDAALGGFNSAFQVLVDSMETYRENEAYLQSLQYERQLQAWKNYALKLQASNLELRRKDIDLVNDYNKLLKDANANVNEHNAFVNKYDELHAQLAKEKKTGADYLTSLSRKLVLVNKFIKRLSAKSFAYEKLSERLAAELHASTVSDNSIVKNPDDLKKQLTEDFEGFMETNEVRKFNYIELANINKNITVPTVQI